MGAHPAVRVAVEVAALLALVFLYEALPEELIFRGYVFRTLAGTMPSWATVLVLGLIPLALAAPVFQTLARAVR